MANALIQPMSTEAPSGGDFSSYIEAARALVPTLRQREASALAARQIPSATIDDYEQLGLLRILQPKRYGGLAAPYSIFSKIVEELTYGCASSAWVYAVLVEHSWIISCFSEQAQLDVWGANPLSLASSSLAPRGTATVVSGGFNLSGRFAFSSGCAHADWVIVCAFTDESERKIARYFLVPISNVSILDDWNVLGLRATGSCTLVIEEAFVPSHRSVLVSDLEKGTPPGRYADKSHNLARAPRGLFAIFSQPPVTLSLGQRVLDIVSSSLANRVTRGAGNVAESQITQTRLAEAAAGLDVARMIIYGTLNRSEGLLNGGDPISQTEILRVRRDVIYAQRLVHQSVKILTELVGSDWVYDQSPLQPIIRDLQTTSTHISANWEYGMIPYGRMQLGLDKMALYV